VSHELRGDEGPGDRRDARDRAGDPGSSPGQAFEAFLAAGARVAVNGSSAASVAAALEGLRDRERAVAAPGDLGEVAGCRRVVEGAAEGRARAARPYAGWTCW